MAVKTTKIQCNQDVDLRGKADIEGKVTCGNDVEVDGKLTINSAKDLKTKDGSSFGVGGGDVSLNKVNEFVKGDTIISLIDTVSNPWGYGYYTGIMSKIKGKTYQTSPFIFIGLEGTGTDLKPVALVADSLSSSASKVEFHVGDYGEWGMVINHNGYTRYLSGEIYYESYHLSFPTKSGTLALKTDIPDMSTKQSILYRHTVRIGNNTRKASLSFMTESEKNTKVDSIQDLIAVFGNTTVGVSGYAYYEAYGYILLALTVGTDINTTKVDFIDTAAGESVQLSFTDIFGTDGFSITDNVTTM